MRNPALMIVVKGAALILGRGLVGIDLLEERVADIVEGLGGLDGLGVVVAELLGFLTFALGHDRIDVLRAQLACGLLQGP